MAKRLNEQGRKAQAECLRKFLGKAGRWPADLVEDQAQRVERGDVEYDPDWLESIADGRS